MQEKSNAYIRISMRKMRTRYSLPREGGRSPRTPVREVWLEEYREAVFTIRSQVGQSLLDKLSDGDLPALMT
jgi:hypothetical protein